MRNRIPGALKKRTTHTATRLMLRDLLWEPVRALLLEHFKRHGAKIRMGDIVGCASSQLHCFTCPTCEHDQEPTFSTGLAMLIYLSQERWKARSVVAGQKVEIPELIDELIQSVFLADAKPPIKRKKIAVDSTGTLFSL